MQPEQRVFTLGIGLFLCRAILLTGQERLFPLGMTTAAMGLGFDQGGAFAPPGARHGFGGDIVHGKGVAAIGNDTRDTVALGA